MKYKVLIQTCTDPVLLQQVAAEIAKWSGSPLDVVTNALATKPICIRKEAEEAEANELKARFSQVGAIVEIVPLPTTVPKKAVVSSDDDDDDDGPGRLLSEAEYLKVLQSRPDIFHVENDKKLRVIQLVSVVIGLIFGTWISTMKVMEVKTDFFDKVKTENAGKFVKSIDATLDKQKEEKEKIPTPKEKDESKLNPSKNKGKNLSSSGGGDPRARVTRQGVLGIISGAVKGKSVANADIFAKGGYATGIDAVLSGVGGLKAGGDGGVGRKGAAGIGYGAGYGSGFGGGSGGIDDLVGSLMGGDNGGSLALKGKRGADLKMAPPDFANGAALTGGRSKASIQRVVMQNMAALRYAYNKRLHENPDLKGKVTVKFAINEFGNVIYCSVVGSTMGTPDLEAEIVDKIKRWMFDKIDKPGDVTEVTYPFVFSP